MPSFGIGVYIGRWNIAIGSDDRQDFRGVAARHALEFALRHALRVANDSPLAAAIGNIYRSGFPGHPCGESLYFVERYAGVVANSALRRTARNVVLHTKSSEHFDLAIIELHGHGHFQNALRSSQYLPQARIEFQIFGSHIELKLRDAK